MQLPNEVDQAKQGEDGIANTKSQMYYPVIIGALHARSNRHVVVMSSPCSHEEEHARVA